MAAAKVCVKG